MPPVRSDTDVFSALADANRRTLIDLLAVSGELSVNALVEQISLPQPAVSKHLAVLRDVGLVAVRRKGRERMYSLEASKLRAVHEWTRTFERLWTHQTDRIKARAEQAAREDNLHAPSSNPRTKRKDDRS